MSDESEAFWEEWRKKIYSDTVEQHLQLVVKELSAVDERALTLINPERLEHRTTDGLHGARGISA